MTTAHESRHEYPDRWSPQKKAVVAVILWPVVITAVAVLWYLSFMSELPAQVATHWSRRGPDGFTARETLPWIIAAGGLVTPWFIGGVILAIAGRDGRQRRITVGFVAGLAVFSAGLMVIGSWDQRGLADGTLARDAEWPLVAATLIALVIGVGAAFTVPGHHEDATRATGAVAPDAPRTELEPGQRAAWSAVAAPGRWFWVFMAVMMLVLLGTGWLTGLWLFTGLIVLLVIGMMLALSVFRVTVGEHGMVVAGGLGFPRWRLPLEDVVAARATTVDPFAEFGGWGYRVGLHNRTGFVVRKGEALEVERGDGSRWVVTVDDAEQGAALLNTLAERVRR